MLGDFSEGPSLGFPGVVLRCLGTKHVRILGFHLGGSLWSGGDSLVCTSVFNMFEIAWFGWFGVVTRKFGFHGFKGD